MKSAQLTAQFRYIPKPVPKYAGDVRARPQDQPHAFQRGRDCGAQVQVLPLLQRGAVASAPRRHHETHQLVYLFVSLPLNKCYRLA